ncbi:uncharacterized protein L203_102511 [Cryptococcus depauperatus CBS 7841]|uniref:Uncharacterized protein n=1 Tax=Cryptococcus depauperatus CBS 7841 TaxID=1295531 RepID=A0A1E3IDC0_9TREE|nr:hypothetical protein L203_03869 [Cryptococcus depauperatus CBS 7841]
MPLRIPSRFSQPSRLTSIISWPCTFPSYWIHHVNPRIRPLSSQKLVNREQISLENALVKQDPYERIWFLQPVSTLNFQNSWMRQAHLRSLWPQMIGEEPYLVPFWLLLIICDQHSEARHRESGSPDYNNTAERFYSDISLTMAAVPDDHWCSGVYFPMNIRGAATLQQRIIDEPQSPLAKFMPFPSPSIYTSPSFGEPLIDWNTYNPDLSPKFAWGPPKLEKRDMDRIVESQASGALQQEGWDVIFTRAKDTKLFAIPIYRLVHKIYLENGNIGISDGELNSAAHNFEINWPRSQCQRVDYTKSPNGLVFSRVYPSHHYSGVIHHEIDDKGSSAILATLFSAMRRAGPITERFWENDKILPLVGKAGIDSVLPLVNYSDEVLHGRGSSLVEPSFRIRKLEQSQTELSSIFGSAKSKSKRPALASSALASAPSSDTASPLSSKATKTKPTLSWSSLSHKRDSTISAFARERMSRIVGSYEPIVHSKQNLNDPMGHYARLGLTKEDLTLDFLSPRKERAINSIIKQKYKELRIAHHPDKSGGSHEIFVAVGEAYHHVNSLKARMAYNEKKLYHVTKSHL